MQACSNGSSLSYRNGMQLITTQRILRKLLQMRKSPVRSAFSRSLGAISRSNNHIWRFFLPFYQLCTLSWTSTLVNLSSSLSVLCRIKQLHEKSNRAMTPTARFPRATKPHHQLLTSPSATVLPQVELRFLSCGSSHWDFICFWKTGHEQPCNPWLCSLTVTAVWHVSQTWS